jgi:hypothetical protein
MQMPNSHTSPSNFVAASKFSEWNFKAKLCLLRAENLSIKGKYREAGETILFTRAMIAK